MSTPRSNTLGRTIRTARIAAGLTLRGLAELIKRAPSYLNDIEHDRRVPSEEVLLDLCRELGLDVNELMGKAGRVGQDVEDYLRSEPSAALLFRTVSAAALNAKQLAELQRQVEELRHRRPPKQT